jgi:hypothetical protein
VDFFRLLENLCGNYYADSVCYILTNLTGGKMFRTNAAAVRVTHLPTGIAVTVDSQRSQHRNRAEAINQLRSKLHAVETLGLGIIAPAPPTPQRFNYILPDAEPYPHDLATYKEKK